MINFQKNSLIKLCTLSCLLLLVLPGCSYIVKEEVFPAVNLQTPFTTEDLDSRSGRIHAWWKALGDPILDKTIGLALDGNFSLKQSYARIKQAKLAQEQVGSEKLPELSGSMSTSPKWTADGKKTEKNALELLLSWELDLWHKITAAEKEMQFEADALEDEWHNAALLLSVQVAETYFQIIEFRQQLALLDAQNEVNNTFLELIELRFVNGKASMVDVYQQKQQLASIKTQIPITRAKLRSMQNRLQILLGLQPGEDRLEFAQTFPKLAPLPLIGIPADLLSNRPDLLAAKKQLIAADYKVAQAVAARLPQLKITGNSGYEGNSLLSDNLFLSIIGEAVSPLIDWQKRKNEVERQKAVVEERLSAYSHLFLIAIEEVENALWQEKEQIKLLEALNEQLTLAKANVSEAKNRYMQGLTDYLPVLTALHTLQGLEKEIITRDRQLISGRILLYRSLGGTVFE